MKARTSCSFQFWLLLACTPSPAPSDSPPLPAPQGQLTLVQIDCEGWLGEAMLIIGPDGTTVLIDAGNDDHVEIIAAAVEARTGDTHVDALLLTHFHEDHAGGLGGLPLDIDLTVSRGPVHLDAVDLPDGFDRTPRVDLCTDTSCDLPWILDLGEGATLTVFAADGQIDGQRFGDLPGDDDGENARSLVGIVEWGSFTYLFNGDLTGGGKDTPDMESFYAARMDAWVPASGATIGHLGHHGIDSSTWDAWIARVFPSGSSHVALVGSNGSYLDAPADEVLDRVRDHVQSVWVTRGGAFTGEDPLLRDAEDDVVIDVSEGGAAVNIHGGALPDEILAP